MPEQGQAAGVRGAGGGVAVVSRGAAVEAGLGEEPVLSVLLRAMTFLARPGERVCSLLVD